MHTEGLEIFYNENRFRFHSTSWSLARLQTLPSAAWKYLRNVELVYVSEEEDSGQCITATCWEKLGRWKQSCEGFSSRLRNREVAVGTELKPSLERDEICQVLECVKVMRPLAKFHIPVPEAKFNREGFTEGSRLDPALGWDKADREN